MGTHDLSIVPVNDVRFHRAIADAAGNPILAVLMETVVGAMYDDRRRTVDNPPTLDSPQKCIARSIAPLEREMQ
jgi:DNA-binding FadR family transcriptional regulator